MNDHLCVIGHPSRYGGADTELDHQIRCWQAMGMVVHICHTGALDENLRAMRLAERGCVYHEPSDWKSIAGLDCISFCNAEFLKSLPEIKEHARSTTFVNCMTWNFDAELAMQERGLIDFHLYQTAHAQERVGRRLAQFANYRPVRFTPYFHSEDFQYIDDRPQDKFRFGRISRADADKFNDRQLWIYETMTAPVLKEGQILGWGPKVEEKFGGPPHSYIEVLPAGAISQQEFYRYAEAVIMTTDTIENLPRVGFEAMASGSVLIVDSRGGWKEQVDDGVTGWLCRDDREFVYKASRCAFEGDERNRMRRAALDKLERHWGLQAAMDSWAAVFASWRSI